MAFIYFSWVIYLGGLIFFILSGDYLFSVFWLIWLPFVMWVYIRKFPSISHLAGYGKVDDTGVEQPRSSTATVTFYTALGCPFCSIVARRLKTLQERMGFSLVEIDVTLRPDILKGKKILAVPVVEVEGGRLTGNATSLQLADLISRERADG